MAQLTWAGVPGKYWGFLCQIVNILCRPTQQETWAIIAKLADVCYDEHEENENDDDINYEELHNCLYMSYTIHGKVSSHIFSKYFKNAPRYHSFYWTPNQVFEKEKNGSELDGKRKGSGPMEIKHPF